MNLPDDSLGAMPDCGDCVGVEEVVLVTGSNGFIGVKVVESLLARGFRHIRCFVRPSSRRERLSAVIGGLPDSKGVEVCEGDLLSREDCRRATAGVSVIYHLAAGFDKSFAGAFMNSVLSTRNLIEAFLESGKVKRFVNVSSSAVYSNFNMRRGATLDENSPLEDAPQARFDAYGFGKLKQEQTVRYYGDKRGLPYVILRPGMVFGPGKRDLSGRVGIDTFGFFMQVGGSQVLPMTFVDNCADAVVLAGLRRGVEGEVFNIVDDDLLTGSEFLRAYKGRVSRFFSVRLPYSLAYVLCALWERYSRWSEGQLPLAFNKRRCSAEWKGNRFSNQKLRERLGWKPRVPLEQAMSLFLGQFEAK
ncbi:MAG: NAD(P)-dependent oxidoreductase [Chthoniobacteraceae bacterium]